MFHVSVLWVTLPFSFFPANRYGFLNMTWFLWGRGGNYCSHLALLKQVLIWLPAIISASLLIFYMGTYGGKERKCTLVVVERIALALLNLVICVPENLASAFESELVQWDYGYETWEERFLTHWFVFHFELYFPPLPLEVPFEVFLTLM